VTIVQTDIVRKRSQLSDDASAYVRNLIMSGRLLPGESVRPEIIGDALGISTTPAREALQALRVEGFLQLLPRRGFIVAPLTGQDIRDLFTAQSLVSGELAARATQAATEADIVELEALHHELLAAAGRHDLTVLEEKNHAFHRQVNKIADSRKIAWVLGLLDRYVPHLFYSQIEGWPETTTADHNAIISAIKNHDSEAARSAMATHITHSGELLAAAFDIRASASADGTKTD
jgi:DNA-binding GntR family transcriptional regulator